MNQIRLNEALVAELGMAGEILREGQRSLSSMQIENKADGSPVTEMEKRVSRLLSDSLTQISGLPVISEESIPAEREGWQDFWLIDPLDGTKDFLRGSPEYCIALCLVRGRRPEFAAVHAPALEEFHLAGTDFGYDCRGKFSPSVGVNAMQNLKFIESRSHPSKKTNLLLDELGIADRMALGSGLKFARIAAGEADISWRPGGGWEWDLAFGDLILSASGGRVVSIESPSQPFLYNTPELRQSGWLALSKSALRWQEEILAAVGKVRRMAI